MRKTVILLILGAMTLFPMQSKAMRGDRAGFVLGLGAGLGSAEIRLDGKVDGEDVSGSDSQNGLATVFKLGGSVHDNVELFLSNRTVFFTFEDDMYFQGMSAIGVACYVEEDSPSLFLGFELGVGTLMNFEASETDSGIGGAIVAGFALGNQWVAELSFLRAGVAKIDGFDVSINNLSLTVSRNLY